MLRAAKRGQGLSRCEDEARVAPWGSLRAPWARGGRQPEGPTRGTRQGDQGCGAIAYGAGRLLYQGIEGGLHAASFQGFVPRMLEQTTPHVWLIHDGAR
jgi:hypothetical protein